MRKYFKEQKQVGENEHCVLEQSCVGWVRCEAFKIKKLLLRFPGKCLLKHDGLTDVSEEGRQGLVLWVTVNLD